MNKYIIIIIVLVLIIASGAVYRAKFVPEIEKALVTGIERSITIVVFENTWAFEPEFIEADQGDKIIFTITNRDDYDHGFAIDAFGISQRMPAKSTIQIEFVVTKAGDFPYYCSVSCGSGIIDGEKRGHFNQVGRLHVRSVISETSGFGEAISDEDFAKSARQASALAPSNEKAGELGYNVSNLSVVFDEENVLWKSYANSENINIETLNLSEEVEFQAILYQDNDLNSVLWIFIDNLAGEVINVLEVGG